MTEIEKIILQSQRTILLGLSVLVSINGQENQGADPMNRMAAPKMHPLLSSAQDQIQAAMVNITLALANDRKAEPFAPKQLSYEREPSSSRGP